MCIRDSFQGLYMRRVMDKEKAERLANGSATPAYVIEADDSKPAKSKQSVNGSGAGKSKSTGGQTTAKRKKRSAKR